MAKRHLEEFNPWPSFVDIFSSVILVMLLFLLVVLVNLAYYSQFKHKVSYTGSISTFDLSSATVQEIAEAQSSSSSQSTTTSQSTSSSQSSSSAQSIIVSKDKATKIKEIINEKLNKSEIISGGVDVLDTKDKDTGIEQKFFEGDDYFIVTFKGSEMFVSSKTAKDVQVFIDKMKSRYKKHKIVITTSDSKIQASATVTKQISLARSLGVRNLIRKMKYDKKDVRIKLNSKIKIKEKINTLNGYLVIRVER
ncbi:MAG: hypothetical protein COA66_10055 [Arcobacter sp.]|nr:MAG: hypothetical protein COA66_10055 [Arcobacter sp.]